MIYNFKKYSVSVMGLLFNFFTTISFKKLVKNSCKIFLYSPYGTDILGQELNSITYGLNSVSNIISNPKT